MIYQKENIVYLHVNVIARSDVCPPGMRTVADSIHMSGKTFFH